MNRTQRAIKKSLHRTFDHAKRQKRQALYERNEASTPLSRAEKREKLQQAVRNEKDLKTWHRKIVQDYAGNTLKEEKTA